MRIALLRCNPDCATFNPTLLDGEQGKKRDDCGTDHGVLSRPKLRTVVRVHTSRTQLTWYLYEHGNASCNPTTNNTEIGTSSGFASLCAT
jgi:hypothetical protein